MPAEVQRILSRGADRILDSAPLDLLSPTAHRQDVSARSTSATPINTSHSSATPNLAVADIAAAAMRNMLANGMSPSEGVRTSASLSESEPPSSTFATKRRLALTLCADGSLAAWKMVRLDRLSRMRHSKKIGPRLHAKAIKATAQMRALDDSVALAFNTFSSDERDGDLAQCLHGMLASDPALAENPATY